MAHYEKFTRGAVGHMLQHYDRTKGSSRSSIDESKSSLNYNLVDHGNQLEYLHKRLNEVHLSKRKDVNVLCDWVVTAPKDLPENQLNSFFRHTVDFLKEKYGEENTVSAYVHMDENTPHIHFAFIPVVPDPKHGGFKVSAKECVRRSDLQQFHQQLQNYLELKLGTTVGILNDATRDGNRTIEELKRGTAKKELDDLQAQKESLQADLKALEGQILTSQQVKAQTVSKSLLGGHRGTVKLSYENYKDLKATAEQVDSYKKQAEQAVRNASAVISRKEQLILDGQREAAAIKEKAEKESRSILNKAREMANAMIDSAQIKAQEIEKSAQSQSEQIIKDAQMTNYQASKTLDLYKKAFLKNPSLKVQLDETVASLSQKQSKRKGRTL